MKYPTLNRTKKYSQFRNSIENRDLELHKLRPEHKKLYASMKRQGFLPSFPISVVSNPKGGQGYIVKDGQHRLAFAEELGLDVFFVVVEDVDFEVAELQSTQAKWKPLDFAKRWAASGNSAYIEALNFMRQYPEISPTWAFALLSGTRTFGNIKDAFESGRFTVKAEDSAHRVAGIYSALKKRNPKINQSFLYAAYSVCLVDYFDEDRLIHKVDKFPSMLHCTSNKDDALDVLEKLYNYHSSDRYALRIDAEKASKARAACLKEGS